MKNPNLIELDFIPFGNAHEEFNTSTNKYDFTCQHGENECYGNLIETCAIQIQGRVKSYETIICIESNIGYYSKDFDKTLEFCLSKEQNILKEIKDCLGNDLGNFYQHQMAQKTDVNHKYVPWIVVNMDNNNSYIKTNNAFSNNNNILFENEIIASLIDYICGNDKTKCYGN